MPSCPLPTLCTITPLTPLVLTAEALKHKNNGLHILTLQYISVKHCVHILDEFVLTCSKQRKEREKVWIIFKDVSECHC